MTGIRFTPLALPLAVALWLSGPVGAIAATAKATPIKGQPAQAAAPSACNLLADDPEDPFRAAPGVDQHAIDPSKAIPACKAALEARPDDGRLWYAYARALQRGQDNAGGLDAYQQAAARGYPVAENLIGVMYQNARHLDEAAQWIRKSADHGYMPAQTILASFYINGWGVPQDNRLALEWYRKAADRGYPLAQVNLAALYHSGQAWPKDDQQALQWARKASDQNYAPAQSILAGMYHNGWGVKADDRTAMALYVKAADQGYYPAQAQLGLMYHNGWGVPVDDVKARDWFQKAASAGYAPAAEILAAMNQAQPPAR